MGKAMKELVLVLTSRRRWRRGYTMICFDDSMGGSGGVTRGDGNVETNGGADNSVIETMVVGSDTKCNKHGWGNSPKA